jgi:hypothetical protein
MTAAAKPGIGQGLNKVPACLVGDIGCAGWMDEGQAQLLAIM